MSSRIRSHRDLIVWQRAIKFVSYVYQCTEEYPKKEMYGLTDQTRRAAVSVPANIAEGYGRRSDGAFSNHLSIALGSIAELDTHFQIAAEISYLAAGTHRELRDELVEIRKMLYGLHRSVKHS